MDIGQPIRELEVEEPKIIPEKIEEPAPERYEEPKQPSREREREYEKEEVPV